MTSLAELEAALWSGKYHNLAESHAHRATREDSIGIIKGRDAITAAWVAQDGLVGAVADDLGEMVAVAGDGWHLHRWVWREDGRIVREIEVTDRARDVHAGPVHPPLGELSAGRGQYAASSDPDLPPGFPPKARALGTSLHRQWNGRDFSQGVPSEIRVLIQGLPDAVFLFEHAVVTDDASAILFRVMGHHVSGPKATGQRVRLIGSIVVTGAATNICIDQSAYTAQLARPLIDYG